MRRRVRPYLHLHASSRRFDRHRLGHGTRRQEPRGTAARPRGRDYWQGGFGEGVQELRQGYRIPQQRGETKGRSVSPGPPLTTCCHIVRRSLVKQITLVLFAVVMVACVVVLFTPASGHAAGEAAPVYVTQVPPGYRDWRFLSTAHEEGNLNSLGAVLGNDTAIKAYRDGKLPFPDGTIVAALHYHHVPSEENNKSFGRAQSFVPGSPTNIQFMVKDSTK